MRASRKEKPRTCRGWKRWKTQLADEPAKPAADELPGELSCRRPEGDVEKRYLSASRLMMPG